MCDDNMNLFPTDMFKIPDFVGSGMEDTSKSSKEVVWITLYRKVINGKEEIRYGTYTMLYYHNPETGWTAPEPHTTCGDGGIQGTGNLSRTLDELEKDALEFGSEALHRGVVEARNRARFVEVTKQGCDSARFFS